ncbi:hypothetical protein FJU30_06970 [Affinibrenneria salicis]|uniref:Uncharacterized protein n=1 Tax=Affinibrenneria salicis TaxID=2590031 RepID=A0A5J5G566_9GAMM|nr:hypothetical protein [Affinibrenneria salicis]KAA9002014.1 hypothetical protein FJU30_06970 [Affinibrenneria salicis]
MMNDKLVELNTLLAAPAFFVFLRNIDIDDALDRRDEPAFDRVWNDNFRRTEKRILPPETLTFIDGLREKSFKDAFRLTQDDELAARISDDIALIAKDIALETADSWPVNVLWPAYKRGVFPTQGEI